MTDDLTFMSRRRTYEPEAKTALAAGIVAILLLWPLGILLGPMAIWSGVWARRRIRAGDGKLAGEGLAVAGIAIGSTACVLCTLGVIAELGAFILAGSLIPAP